MRFTNPRVYNEVNELSRLIHDLDPNHPTTTTISAIEEEVVELVRERAPDLDFISLQAYGALFLMPKAIRYLRAGPFMITEWGPLGHWEVGKTRWGAPIEQNSTEKGTPLSDELQDPHRTVSRARARFLRLPVGAEAGTHAHLVQPVHRGRQIHRRRGCHAVRVDRSGTGEPGTCPRVASPCPATRHR